MAYTAGLNSDDLDEYPSAASPLTAMGLDPDEVAANPDLIAGINPNPDRAGHAPMPGIPLRSAANPIPPAVAGATLIPSTPADSSAPTDTDTIGHDALALGYKNAQSAQKEAEEMSTEPPADIARLTAQRGKLAVPAPRFDPASGQQLDQTSEYDPATGAMVNVNPKEGTGGKIWRGVRGGIVGLMTGGIPGAVVGALEPQDIRGGKAYNAPSKAYEQAEQRREQQLGATDASLASAEETWKAVNQARKDKSGAFNAVSTAAKDVTTGASDFNKNTIAQFKADATAANYKTKADEAQDKLQEQMNRDLQTAQTNEQRLSIMRDNAAALDQIRRAQLDFARQKLDTSTDAKSIDQWQKEQIDSINKDYNGVFSSAWNGITQGSKQARINQINQAADSRRAAMGLGTGTAVNKGAGGGAAPAPSGKGVSLAEARQLPQYLGKTDAQIKADIIKFGHTVQP